MNWPDEKNSQQNTNEKRNSRYEDKIIEVEALADVHTHLREGELVQPLMAMPFWAQQVISWRIAG